MLHVKSHLWGVGPLPSIAQWAWGNSQWFSENYVWGFIQGPEDAALLGQSSVLIPQASSPFMILEDKSQDGGDEECGTLDGNGTTGHAP